MVAHAVIQPFPPGLFVLVVLWPLLTPDRRIAPQCFHALVRALRMRHAAFTQCKPNLPQRTLDRVSGINIHSCPHLVRFGLLFGSCSSCLCFASGFLPTPHCCDAVAFGYLIPPCLRSLGTSTPVTCHA